jgi:DNA-binding NtrC family response regulator
MSNCVSVQVIDDNEGVRQTIGRYFTSPFCPITLSEKRSDLDFRHNVFVINAQQSDTDISLSETIKKICDQYPNIPLSAQPIIIMTDGDSDPTINVLREQKVTILEKPCNLSKLYTEIASVMANFCSFKNRLRSPEVELNYGETK